jgi:hypothetical protein
MDSDKRTQRLRPNWNDPGMEFRALILFRKYHFPLSIPNIPSFHAAPKRKWPQKAL